MCLFPRPPEILNEFQAKLWATDLLDTLGAETAIEESIFVCLIPEGKSIKSVIDDFKIHWERTGQLIDFLNRLEDRTLN